LNRVSLLATVAIVFATFVGWSNIAFNPAELRQERFGALDAAKVAGK
jgi:hypothetical protein